MKNKSNMIKTKKFINNKLGIKGKIEIGSTYGNYYKVNCKNNIILLSNENKDYNLGYKNNKISDKKIGNKKILRNNLQNQIQTCEKFYNLFEIKRENGYKYYPEYENKKEEYKKYLNRKYGEKLEKIKKLGKINQVLEKIEKLRNKINLSQKSKQEKEKINILLDSLEEILKK